MRAIRAKSRWARAAKASTSSAAAKARSWRMSAPATNIEPAPVSTTAPQRRLRLQRVQHALEIVEGPPPEGVGGRRVDRDERHQLREARPHRIEPHAHGRACRRSASPTPRRPAARCARRRARRWRPPARPGCRCAGSRGWPGWPRPAPPTAWIAGACTSRAPPSMSCTTSAAWCAFERWLPRMAKVGKRTRFWCIQTLGA